MNVIELHKDDLAKGHKALAEAIKKFGQGSAEMWDIKGRITKYEIAYNSAFNNAVVMLSTQDYSDTAADSYLAIWHLQFYQRLTAPYRPEKKLKEGMANIDDEVVLHPDEDTEPVIHPNN